MARYIDADNIRYHKKENIDGYVYSEVVNKYEIDSIPTEDVRPVIHAKWIPTMSEKEAYCSRCNGFVTYNPLFATDKYCRFCGAKMDKEG